MNPMKMKDFSYRCQTIVGYSFEDGGCGRGLQLIGLDVFWKSLSKVVYIRAYPNSIWYYLG